MLRVRELPSDSGPAPTSEDDADSDDGVDGSLVRWTLGLTPLERLRILQANADALARLRDGSASKR